MFVALQYLLPHHLLCRLVRALTRSERAWLKNRLIQAFIRHYAPAMHEALEPEPLAYASFNAFFTRALRPGARVPAPGADVVDCPCDGTVYQAGRASGDSLLQAKSHRYSLTALLAAQSDWSERLRDGLCATLYLAPRDYHRVHMPLAGRLSAAWHVPGRLFSVNAATTARVPGLFARNERVVCAFEGDDGPFLLVLVGALFVGSLSTVWHGDITLPRTRASPRLLVAGGGVPLWLPQGAEMGRFNMGSTVILLLPPGRADWDAGLRAGLAVRVAQALGRLRR